MPQTGKPLFNDPTFENISDNLRGQGNDVAKSLQNLVTNSDSSNSDSGIEQLTGQKSDDPTQPASPASRQIGLNPQQLMEKRAKEKEKIEFYQTQVKGWEEHQLQADKEAEQRKQQAAEEEKRKKEQGIIELQQEEAKNAALNPPKAKGPTGPGSAFVPTVQQKTSMGTGELRNTITN